MSARPLSSGRIWAALAIPPMAWFGYQQGWGQAVRLACRFSGPPLGPLTGALALLACCGAALMVWRQARTNGPEPHDHARAVLAWSAIGLAAVFALAIAWQMLATVLSPPCAR